MEDKERLILDLAGRLAEALRKINRLEDALKRQEALQAEVKYCRLKSYRSVPDLSPRDKLSVQTNVL